MEPVLYLIPAPLGEGPLEAVLPQGCLQRIQSLDHFVVEELRTARRYLSQAGHKGRIEGLWLRELNEHSTPTDVAACLQPLLEGHSLGLVSEAGLPAVADPGADLVALAHAKGIAVVPLSGPSSLFLALMASGLNGQCFAFNGYLPVKPEPRRQKIKYYENRSRTEGRTEIFIETPYRNEALLEALLATCHGATRLCLAADLTCPDAWIRSRSVAQWKAAGWGDLPPDFKKKPCVFLLLA